MKPAPPNLANEAANQPVRRDGVVLAVAVLAVAAALVLEERPGGRLALFGRESLVLPNVCASRIVLGVACPGCGLTRAVVRLAHGDWRGSWRPHRLGVPAALVILAQIPYRLVVLGRSRRGRPRAAEPADKGRLDVST